MRDQSGDSFILQNARGILGLFSQPACRGFLLDRRVVHEGMSTWDQSTIVVSTICIVAQPLEFLSIEDERGLVVAQRRKVVEQRRRGKW